MSAPHPLNQAVIAQALHDLRNGQLRRCKAMGFGDRELRGREHPLLDGAVERPAAFVEELRDPAADHVGEEQGERRLGETGLGQRVDAAGEEEGNERVPERGCGQGRHREDEPDAKAAVVLRPDEGQEPPQDGQIALGARHRLALERPKLAGHGTGLGLPARSDKPGAGRAAERPTPGGADHPGGPAQARANAASQHLYITPYVRPHLPQSSTYPNRPLAILIVGMGIDQYIRQRAALLTLPHHGQRLRRRRVVARPELLLGLVVVLALRGFLESGSDHVDGEAAEGGERE